LSGTLELRAGFCSAAARVHPEPEAGALQVDRHRQAERPQPYEAQAQVTFGHDTWRSIQILIDGWRQIECTVTSFSMRFSTASFALAAVLSVPVITMASSAAAGQGLSPEQSQALFQARKTWSKDNYQRRLELLQSQQRCIDAAASADALKMCRQEMKKARKSFKQDYRAYMNKVRNQLGLPARTGNKRDAKGRKLQA
jgi:hypothetical protein